jgi:hypothetical protein
MKPRYHPRRSASDCGLKSETTYQKRFVMSEIQRVLSNQGRILANQRKLDKVLNNQKRILANQGKLDLMLRNQKKILANQSSILANQKRILAKVT